MTTLGLLFVGWVAGALTVGLALFVWALVEERCRKDQPWWEEQPW